MTTTRTPRYAAALARWVLLLALSFTGLAMAQTEATLDQVYQAAQAGHVEQALQMMVPVLKAHPGSGKAHYVQAELLARQGQASEARAELATAERLAPGLPFAKADAVQHLQRQLALPPAAGPAGTRQISGFEPAPARQAMDHAGAGPAGASVPWGVVLALAGGAIAAWGFMRLSRPARPAVPPGAMAGPLAGTGWPSQAAAGGMGPGAMAYPAQAAGVGGMAVPAQPAGLGSRLAGGLATGLAVGAGVMAAESIGKNLFGGSTHAAPAPDLAPTRGYDPVFGDASANADMGGNDFGIGDASSWDDGATGGGSSDWDT